MSKGNVGLGWFRRISSQRALEINARMEALEYRAREGADRTSEVFEQIRELQANLDESVAENKKLRSDVARLEKQLAWISEEAQKTGTALFECIKTLKRYIHATPPVTPDDADG